MFGRDAKKRLLSLGDKVTRTFFPLLLAGLAMSQGAFAGEVSTTFNVSVRVVAACSVSTKALTLTPYTSGGSKASTTQIPGSIDVQCSSGTPAQVTLQGEQLLHGPAGNTVAYNLTANGLAWAKGTPLSVVGKGLMPVHVAIGGSIPAGHELTPGDYSNTQIVLVSF